MRPPHKKVLKKTLTTLLTLVTIITVFFRGAIRPIWGDVPTQKRALAPSPPEPLVPLMCFLDRHHFENGDNAPGQDIEERSIGMSDKHPAVTVLQQLRIRGSIGILKFEQVLFDDPAILLWQAVNVLQRPLFDVYSHDASLFSGLRIRDRCRAGRTLLPLRSYPGVQ